MAGQVPGTKVVTGKSCAPLPPPLLAQDTAWQSLPESLADHLQLSLGGARGANTHGLYGSGMAVASLPGVQGDMSLSSRAPAPPPPHTGARAEREESRRSSPRRDARSSSRGGRRRDRRDRRSRSDSRSRSRSTSRGRSRGSAVSSTAGPQKRQPFPSRQPFPRTVQHQQQSGAPVPVVATPNAHFQPPAVAALPNANFAQLQQGPMTLPVPAVGTTTSVPLLMPVAPALPEGARPADAFSNAAAASSTSSVLLGSSAAFSVKGFKTQRLNGLYTLDASLKFAVNDHGTYWDQRSRIFMYYQLEEKRWALSPLMDGDKNLLHRAQQGGKRSLAHEVSGLRWTEYVNADQKWDTIKLTFSLKNPTQVPRPQVPVFQASNKVVPPVKSVMAQPHVPLVPTSATNGAKKRTVIALRDKQRTDGSKAIKFWAKPMSDPRRDGDIESRILKVLQNNTDVEEVLLLRDGDKVKVAVRFRDTSSIDAMKAIGAVIYPGLEAESVQRRELAPYSDLRGRCQTFIQASPGAHGISVPDAPARAVAAVNEAPAAPVAVDVRTASTTAATTIRSSTAPAAQATGASAGVCSAAAASSPTTSASLAPATSVPPVAPAPQAAAHAKVDADGSGPVSSSSSSPERRDKDKKDKKDKKGVKKEKKKKKDKKEKKAKKELAVSRALEEGIKANIKRGWKEAEVKGHAAPNVPAPGRRSWEVKEGWVRDAEAKLPPGT